MIGYLSILYYIMLGYQFRSKSDLQNVITNHYNTSSTAPSDGVTVSGISGNETGITITFTTNDTEDNTQLSTNIS